MLKIDVKLQFYNSIYNNKNIKQKFYVLFMFVYLYLFVYVIFCLQNWNENRWVDKTRQVE